MQPSVLPLPCVLILSLAAALSARAAADYATPYVFTTLAGISSIGSADGTGAAARFYSPRGVATDTAGNMFVVDEGNHTIRKVTPAGVVTTFAGTAGLPGSADGTGAAAHFDAPQGIVADAAGNLYVTDTGNHTIRKITPAGTVTTFAGLAGVTGNVDATGGSARLNRPRGIAIDPTGNLYVTEAGNHAIRRITPAGVVTSYGSALYFPESSDLYASVSYGAIAVDQAGSAYVSRFMFSDYEPHDPPRDPAFREYYRYYVGYVTKIAPDGTRTDLWETYAKHYVDGRFFNEFASALAVDPTGRLVAANGFRVSRYSPIDGSLSTLAGSGLVGGADGPAESARFGFPIAFAYDRSGNLAVADTGNNNIRTVSPTGNVTTLAGLALENAAATTDGTGSAARFTNPTGTAVDAAGNVYVADTSSHCIRKITPAGVVTTLAGAPGQSGFADGTGTAARFSGPSSVAVDATGTVFVADTNNHTIRRTTATGETSTFAGTAGSYGSNDGQGIAAQFGRPRGVALDPAGNLYVTSDQTVRKISPTGNVTTLAGAYNQASYYDANGTSARFSTPAGIAVGADGNIYVTETPDPDFAAIARIRRITPDGNVTTLAGVEQGYADGSGPAARFHNPCSLAADATGNLFVADSYNQAVRKVTPQGAVTTVAGLADAPGGTDGTGREARFYLPQGIAVDSTGTLYVTSGTTVRKGQLATGPVITQQPQSQTVTSGNNVTFTVTAGSTPSPTYQWYFGSNAMSGANGSTLSLPGVRSSDAGDYTVVVTNSLGSVTSSRATLTVTTPPPPPVTPAGGGSGGGGGAPSMWFFASLFALGVARLLIGIKNRPHPPSAAPADHP
jgi:sugar lactone lactonase YvrE